jgi:hypothetical protein
MGIASGKIDIRTIMKYLRIGDGWGRVLVFGCFVAAFILAPSKIDGFYLVQADHDIGAQLLFREWQQLLGVFDSSPRVFARDLFTFQAAVMFLFALLMLLPKVPLLVSIGGEAALLVIWFVFGDLSASYHAIEAWTVVLAGMFIVTIANWKGGKRDYLVAAAFGAVLGYMPLMRQSATFIVLVPCAAFVSMGAIISAATIYLTRRKKREKLRSESGAVQTKGKGITPGLLWSFSRYASPLAVMLPLFFAVQIAGEAAANAIYNARTPPHGTGYPLFASLGFANNAYGAAWDDDATRSQGLLVESRYWESDSYGQARLTRLWLARVLEDPALILRAAAAKSLYLVRYFSGTLDPLATQQDQYPLKPSSITLLLGISLFAGAVGCCLIFFRYRHDRMLVLFTGTSGLLAGSFLPLVIIAPFYLGSAIACSVTLLLIVLPAAVFLSREKGPGESDFGRNALSYKIAGALGLLALVLLFGFVVARSAINRAEARELVDSDPAEKIKELGYRYAHRFNRLSSAEQRTVADRLVSSKNGLSIFRPLQPFESDPQRIFMPVLAFIGDGARSMDVPPTREGPKLLFVVARMSEQWQMLLPSRVQGPRNSVLVVLKNRDRRAGLHIPNEAPGKYLKIADANWDGRYRMFCLPEPQDIAEEAQFFNVSAYNFKDGVYSQRGLVLDLVSGDRLYRGGQMAP